MTTDPYAKEVELLLKIDSMRERLDREWEDMLCAVYREDEFSGEHKLWQNIRSPEGNALLSESQRIYTRQLAHLGFCAHHDDLGFDCDSATEDGSRLFTFFCKKHGEEHASLIRQRLLDVEAWKKQRQCEIYEILRDYSAAHSFNSGRTMPPFCKCVDGPVVDISLDPGRKITPYKETLVFDD